VGSSRAEPQTLELGAKLLDVQKTLSKPLKPGRKLVSAVRFAGGKIEEISESTIGLIDGTAEVIEETTEPKKRTPVPEAVATTVAAPAIGCPTPDFERAEIRATRVLEAFLTTDQLEDFRTTQSFVAVGQETGHRYLLTSRNAPQRSKVSTSMRSLFDLDEGYALCVHDWAVPTAEELLGLLVCLSVPGAEGYVRFLPEDGLEHPELVIGEGDDFGPFLNRYVGQIGPVRGIAGGHLVDINPNRRN